MDELKVKQALDLLVDAVGSPSSGAPSGPWYEPTDSERDAFAKSHAVSLADLAGYPGQNADGSWPVNTAQAKITPLADQTDLVGLMAYARHGYRGDGVRTNWTKAGLVAARAKCYQLDHLSPDTAAAADAVISGAGNLRPVVAQYLLMLAALVGDAPFMVPRLMTGNLDGSSDVIAANAMLTASPSAGGPGPGIG